MKAKPRVLCVIGVLSLLVGLPCVSCAALTTSSLSTLATSSTTSTSSAGPLLSLLAGIPEDPISQADDFVYLVDYSAMESAYGAIRPADAEEFAGLSDSDVPHSVWWVVFRGAAWSISDHWLAWLEDGPETVGFSPLEVDQAVHFGVPPGDGLMLAGSFDADAIRAACQTNLDLAPQDFDGTTVWLWGEDPADGFAADLSNVLQENPFGGYLGRRQPMIISDDLLVSSADLEMVLAHVDAATGTAPSLADSPGYRAGVNAMGEDADVLQAAIAGPALALSIAYPPLDVDLPSPETATSTPEALPAYEVLVIADVVTDDEQIARLGLVYGDAGSAEKAGSVLMERLETYTSLSGVSFAETLAPPSGTGQRYYVYQGSDRAVVVLEFPAP
ncbi:MAG: hypothetical protein JW990_07170, partial [Thermoleophilia bacterium]|nr:hypothetical protein [Thermoleophilia bacterium]